MQEVFALSALGNKFLPFQVAVGTPGGCEAAVHVTRKFMASMDDDEILAKIRFQ